MSDDTIFGKIIRREIPANIIFENESVVAFRDINPAAPVHVLIVPRKPIRDVAAATAEDRMILGEIVLAAAEIARKEGLTDRGYRLVMNTGPDAGQSVFHLHCHLLGGRELAWPPG